MANQEGIKYKMLLTHEDIAPGANAPAEDRRGLVGSIPLYKIAGAAAEAGKHLVVEKPLDVTLERIDRIVEKPRPVTSDASPLRDDVMKAIRKAIDLRVPGLRIVPSMSAGATAFRKPRSMPAGESISTQS